MNNTKLILPIVLSASSILYADSIVVSKEVIENVYITENSTSYILKNSKDGSVQTISKKRMDIRTPRQSADREELLKQWEYKRNENNANKQKQEAKVLEAHGDSVAADIAHKQFLQSKKPKPIPVQKKALGLGSTMAEVKAELGEPKEVGNKRVNELGLFEYWAYDGYDFSFENGRVSSFNIDAPKQEKDK